VEVRAAARRTLAAGTARVFFGTQFEPPQERLAMRLGEIRSEGVAHVARRRVRLTRSESPAIETLAGRVLQRFPWLDDGEEDEESGAVIVDGVRYFFAGDRAHRIGDAHDEDDPTWILHALTGAHDGPPGDDDPDVRGVATTSLHATVPPGDEPTLHAQVWIDADGLIRRVTWTRAYRWRPRVRPRKRPPYMFRTTELWDFGLPVEIEVPNLTPPRQRSLRQTARELRRMRADYRRRHPEETG
jgi:hypothetical protein